MERLEERSSHRISQLLSSLALPHYQRVGGAWQEDLTSIPTFGGNRGGKGVMFRVFEMSFEYCCYIYSA